MVLLHVKKTDTDQFIHSTSLSTQTDEIIATLVGIVNTRLKIDKVAQFIEDLVKKGPMKPEDKRGLEEGDDSVDMPPGSNFQYQPDEQKYRTGWCVSQDLGMRILETTEAAKILVHKSKAEQRIAVSLEELQEAMNVMKGAVMMAYPAYHGLPPWEPCILIFEDRDIEAVLHGDHLLDVNETSCWFAGKEIQRGKPLSGFVKTTESSKLIVRLQKSGSGAPVREPAIDEETHKKMLSYYHKKQEESKQLEADNEDEYMNSAWANPKQLKAQLHGSREVNWRPG